jgi:cobalt-zinc-cadmium efflux system membrane fusion protein
VAILAPACSPGQAAENNHPAPAGDYVKVAEATAVTTGETLAAAGKVGFDEDHTSRVGSPLSGRVEAILVKPGDTVTRGQPLVTIVSPEVQAALADARAAAADVHVQELNVERLRALHAEQAVAAKDVAQAESDLTKAQAAEARARSLLALLGIRPGEHTSRFTLRAPLAGTVVDRSVLPGTEVRSDGGAALLTISDLRRVWLTAAVHETDLASIRAGQAATVTVAAYPGQTFAARIEHVGEALDPETRTAKLRLVAENPGRALKPEMFARVALPVSQAARVRVPSSAVLTDGMASTVLVAMGNGRYARRVVELGPENDGQLTVLSGLRAGERVVVEGAQFVPSGR